MFPSTSTTVPYQAPHPGRVSGFRLPFPFAGALTLLLCKTKAPGLCKTWALNTSPCTGQIINEHFLHSPSLSNNAGGSSRELSYPSPQQSPACVRIYKHYQQWFYVSSKLLIQVLNSERPANDPWGTPLYTHQLRDDSLHPSPFGKLSMSKPFSVGHRSFCLWIKMWRRPTQKTAASFIRHACNLGKIKHIKLIWQDPFSLQSGRWILTKRSSLNLLLKEPYFSCSVVLLCINVKLTDLFS